MPALRTAQATLFAILFATAYGVLRVACRRWMSAALKRSVLVASTTTQSVAKMEASLFNLLDGVAFLVVGMVVLSGVPWLWPSMKWWDSGSGPVSSIGLPSQLFYVAYGSRYAALLVMMPFEHQRKDVLATFVHHAATAVLVLLSYGAGQVRVGMVTMVLLDIADIPLHMAKQGQYLIKWGRFSAERLACCTSLTRSRLGAWSDALFVTFAVGFTVSRMGMYPYIVSPASVECPLAFGGWEHMPAAESWCVLLLWVLLGLQLVWEWLLLRAVVRVLTVGEMGDNRSDDEDEASASAAAGRENEAAAAGASAAATIRRTTAADDRMYKPKAAAQRRSPRTKGGSSSRSRIPRP